MSRRYARKRDLLNGICPEAIELLKTRRVSATGFSTLRKMKPVRQIKCAELMISANSYTFAFAKAFLSVTPDDLLTKAPATKRLAVVPNPTKTLMEQEANALVEDLKNAEDSYAADMLDLATGCRYFSAWWATREFDAFCRKTTLKFWRNSINC